MLSGLNVSLTLSDDEDRWPWLGPLASIGLLTAVLLAIVGLPTADLHGPLHRLGIMDPLCGGTRAARLFMLGRWSDAWTFNPAIFMIAAAFGGGLARWAYGKVTGRWLHIRVRRSVAVATVAVLFIALEVRQQSIAPLLLSR